MGRIDLFDGVSEFIVVAQCESFRGAAAQLGVTPAAVSQAIRRLESRLGQPVFQRTTRRVTLTENGRALLARLQPAANAVAHAFADAEAQQHRPNGTLRLSVHSMAVPLVLSPVLPAFRRTYPDVRVEIDVRDAPVDVVAGNFDAGIRIGEFIEKDMVSVRVSPTFRWCLLGAPSYFSEHGHPKKLADLVRHECIRFRSPTTGAIARWDFVLGGRAIAVDPGGSLTVNDRAMLLALAGSGMGLIYTSDWAARAELAAGTLESVMNTALPPADALYLYFAGAGAMQPKLRVFIDIVMAFHRGCLVS